MQILPVRRPKTGAWFSACAHSLKLASCGSSSHQHERRRHNQQVHARVARFIQRAAVIPSFSLTSTADLEITLRQNVSQCLSFCQPCQAVHARVRPPFARRPVGRRASRRCHKTRQMSRRRGSVFVLQRCRHLLATILLLSNSGFSIHSPIFAFSSRRKYEHKKY